MVKIVICEDVKQQQELLKESLEKILSDLSCEYELYIFNSGEALFDNYPENIDIFFLDIQMDKLNGMDVAKKIRETDNQRVEIIFTTSLIEYVQEGYEVRAYRYLLKPIKFEDLKKHTTSCIEELSKNRNNYIVVNGKNDIYKINIFDITYIEIQMKEMMIHTINENYNVKLGMNKIEKELREYHFFRCHRSFLINLNYVNKIKQYIAILENKEEIPISRYKFKECKVMLCDYLGDVL
jgi:DNA-binding LytR/AlgR family response regulator